MSIAQQTMNGGFSAGSATALNGGVASALTATGSTQGTAYQLNLGTSIFTTVASSTGAKLLANPTPGDEQWIYNGGAQALTVYPQSGAHFNALSTNAGISLSPNTSIVCKCLTATQWGAILSA